MRQWSRCNRAEDDRNRQSGLATGEQDLKSPTRAELAVSTADNGGVPSSASLYLVGNTWDAGSQQSSATLAQQSNSAGPCIDMWCAVSTSALEAGAAAAITLQLSNIINNQLAKVTRPWRR
jgi:hypothetical protein